MNQQLMGKARPACRHETILGKGADGDTLTAAFSSGARRMDIGVASKKTSWRLCQVTTEKLPREWRRIPGGAAPFKPQLTQCADRQAGLTDSRTTNSGFMESGLRRMSSLSSGMLMISCAARWASMRE